MHVRLGLFKNLLVILLLNLLLSSVLIGLLCQWSAGLEEDPLRELSGARILSQLLEVDPSAAKGWLDLVPSSTLAFRGGLLARVTDVSDGRQLHEPQPAAALDEHLLLKFDELVTHLGRLLRAYVRSADDRVDLRLNLVTLALVLIALGHLSKLLLERLDVCNHIKVLELNARLLENVLRLANVLCLVVQSVPLFCGDPFAFLTLGLLFFHAFFLLRGRLIGSTFLGVLRWCLSFTTLGVGSGLLLLLGQFPRDHFAVLQEHSGASDLISHTLLSRIVL